MTLFIYEHKKKDPYLVGVNASNKMFVFINNINACGEQALMSYKDVGPY